MKIIMGKGFTRYIAETEAEEQEMAAQNFLEGIVLRMRWEPNRYKWLYELHTSYVTEKMDVPDTWPEPDKDEYGKLVEKGLVRMIRKWHPGFPTYDQVERMHKEFEALRKACEAEGLSREEAQPRYDALNKKWDEIRMTEEI